MKIPRAGVSVPVDSVSPSGFWSKQIVSEREGCWFKALTAIVADVTNSLYVPDMCSSRIRLTLGLESQDINMEINGLHCFFPGSLSMLGGVRSRKAGRARLGPGIPTAA